jgi:4'-phosphopantetheinyl transferase
MQIYNERIPDLMLRPNDIHIWFAFQDEILEDSLLLAYIDLMSPDEGEQQQRFYFAKHRHQYLVSRALVRTTLSRYTGIDPRDLYFFKNDYGRPEIIFKGTTIPLRFNLSHTDGLIACAVVLKDDIGMDVEKIDRRGIDLECADRYFSQKEVSDLHQVQEKSKRERFFDYWTLKESYIKARGMGLSIPLDQFSFHVSEHKPLRISFHPELYDNPSQWQFYLFKPTPNHRAALSVRSNNEDVFQLSIKKVVPLLGEETFYCPIINHS